MPNIINVQRLLRILGNVCGAIVIEVICIPTFFVIRETSFAAQVRIAYRAR